MRSIFRSADLRISREGGTPNLGTLPGRRGRLRAASPLRLFHLLVAVRSRFDSDLTYNRPHPSTVARPDIDALSITASAVGKDVSNVINPEGAEILSNVALSSEYEWYEGTFQVPEDPDAHWAKIEWEGQKEGGTIEIDEWSTTRIDASDTTKNFTVDLNGESVSNDGPLGMNSHSQVSVAPTAIENSLRLSPTVSGSKQGFVRMVYENPLLWSPDATMGIAETTGDGISCTIERRSRYPGETATFCPLQEGILIPDAETVETSDGEIAYELPINQLPVTRTIEF